MELTKDLKEVYKKTKAKDIKFIIITGGVLSGLGKGVTSASIGVLLSDNIKKCPIKCDGYLNYDPGTLNPVEHGEVFVLDDGKEVDMDFGHYERFLNITCDKTQNITMGKIYKEILDLERKGEFLGKTVKLIPEVVDYIELQLLNIALEHNAKLVFIEIGGTVGDIENELFIRAIRNLKNKLGNNRVVNLHLVYIPELYNSREQKTKPAQNSIEKLYSRGIRPDFIICRTNRYLDKKSIDKLSVFTSLDKNKIISAVDVENIYDIPYIFKKQNLDKLLSENLGISTNKKIDDFIEITKKINKKTNINSVNIGVCGKYTELCDSYTSIIEALHHASAKCNIKTNIKYIETSELDIESLKELDGIIIPGGFGKRGISGKLKTVKFARENKIPFLGLCLGLQIAIIEFARNVIGLKDANSTEINTKTSNPIITILEGQNLNNLGGTMRLGAYKAILKENTNVYKIYKQKEIYERHRHRYEVNPKYHKILEDNGLIISGLSPNKKLVEFIELKNHPFFIATQAHPEFKSKIINPHPLFVSFLNAVKKKKNI